MRNFYPLLINRLCLINFLHRSSWVFPQNNINFILEFGRELAVMVVSLNLGFSIFSPGGAKCLP